MFLFSLIEAISSKKLRRFKYVREKICQECSSSKYVSIDGVELLVFTLSRWRLWRHLMQKRAAICCVYSQLLNRSCAAASASSWSEVHCWLELENQNLNVASELSNVESRRKKNIRRLTSVEEGPPIIYKQLKLCIFRFKKKLRVHSIMMQRDSVNVLAFVWTWY